MNANSIDMTNAEIYLYADPHGGKPIEMEIEDPKSFRVTPEGGHEITDLAGVGVVMPAGWLQITVYPNRDRTPFNDTVLVEVD